VLFNSIDFAIFLPIVFLLYWFVFNKNLRVQNFFLACASYVFYGWWDWRFLFLIFFSTVVDYSIGIILSRQQKQHHRKFILAISLIVNLGFLGFFKYFNFFVDNFSMAFSLLGRQLELGSLAIVLPVGISFYTFQSLSYTIDIYRRKTEPATDFITYAAFVSFFPQLVAGPIERATNLFPQFFSRRSFQYHQAVNGLRQILWGLFKKIVIADNCAEYANMIFNNHEQYGGAMLLVGALFFAFQIYGDFSGYSDVAIGTARLFGITLMTNFAFPYFSRSIPEFWRRWHISLSTWFRDYLYFPLGGSKISKWKRIRNVFIVFIVSGLWHGANWTFILWGALNAFYFLPSLLYEKKGVGDSIPDQKLPSVSSLISMIFTFSLVVLSWIFFRSENVNQAFEIFSRIFSDSIFILPQGKDFVGTSTHPFVVAALIGLFLVIEWHQRHQQFGLQSFGLTWPRWWRYSFYYGLILLIFFSGGKQQAFIYFQF
jgi:alginate O-acetyltransferase complex protein AlgI